MVLHFKFVGDQSIYVYTVPIDSEKNVVFV